MTRSEQEAAEPVSSKWPVVTVYDPATGECEQSGLPPDEYIILTGRDRYVDGFQIFSNGTVVVIIKRGDPG